MPTLPIIEILSFDLEILPAGAFYMSPSQSLKTQKSPFRIDLNVAEGHPQYTAFEQFRQRWHTFVSGRQTQRGERYSKVEGVLERFPTGAIVDTAADSRYFYLRGRWCGRSNKTSGWLPYLSINETPYFYWNLVDELTSRGNAIGVKQFERAIPLRCLGISRDDTRMLFRLYQQAHTDQAALASVLSESNLSLSVPEEVIDCLRPNTRTAATKAIPTASLRSSSTTDGNLIAFGDASGTHDPCQISQERSNLGLLLEKQPSQADIERRDLEYSMHSTYYSSLSTFRDLLEATTQKPRRRVFDDYTSQILCLIGSGQEWPWGTFRTNCGNDDPTPCDYIVTTEEEIINFVQSGNTLAAIPHVVRNAQNVFETVDVNFDFLRNLRVRCGDDELIEVQDFNQADTQRVNASVDDLYQRFLQPRQDLSIAPMNLLDSRGLYQARANFLSRISRFQGIELAHKWAHESGYSGKASFKLRSEYASYAKACSEFELFALRGAFSGPHTDIFGHTQITCLSGLKAWFVYTIPLWHPDVEQFRAEGDKWSPAGKFKLVLLRPGDLLIMPPGALIIHAPLTIEDSLMAGGMYIDIEQVPWLAKHLIFEIENDTVTNEFLPGDFHIIWKSLVENVISKSELFDLNPNKHQEIICADQDLRNALSCNCTTGCHPETCKCFKRVLSGQHCSAWCLKHRPNRKCCQPLKQ